MALAKHIWVYILVYTVFSTYRKESNRGKPMIKELEHLSYKGEFEELGMLSLEKRKLGGYLNNVYKYLKGGCREDRGKLFFNGTE